MIGNTMNQHTLSRLAITGIAPLCLSGCMVGPHYSGPPAVAPHYSESSTFRRSDLVSAGTPSQTHQWWSDLHDKTLARVIETALASNPDLEAARARIAIARAGISVQRAAGMPKINATTSNIRAKGPQSALLGDAPGGDQKSLTLDLYNSSLDASWELDLFWGHTSAVQGSEANAQAQEANSEDAALGLTSEIAQHYVSLRYHQRALELALRQQDVASEILHLVLRRRTGGLATDIDVAAARDQVEAAEANIAPIRASIDEQIDRLSVLAGKEPGQLDDMLSSHADIPAPPPSISIGTPAEMLRRRPDIRAAERHLAQQYSLIGEERANYFPKINLLGNLGFLSQHPSDLFQSSNLAYLAMPSLQWSFLDFGRTRSRVNQAKASRDEALALYRKTVLSALQDAETALSRYGQQRIVAAQRLTLAGSAQDRLALSKQRYAEGVASKIDILQSESDSLRTQLDSASAIAQLAHDYVALQKSLGMGWRHPDE